MKFLVALRVGSLERRQLPECGEGMVRTAFHPDDLGGHADDGEAVEEQVGGPWAIEEPLAA